MKKERINACQAPRQQSGAITLLVAITLVLLASLASFYSTRSVMVDRLANNNQQHTTQARLAAEAALAWARADLDRRYSANGQGPGFWHNAAQVPCPADHAGPRWQCSHMAVPAHPDMPGTALQILALRDLLSSPHVTQLHATARLTGQAGLGQVRASVFVPTVAPAPQGASTAALLINGCSAPAAGASVTVCPISQSGTACIGSAAGDAVQSLWLPDPNGDGVISSTERRNCLAFLPEHLPGGGGLSGPATAVSRAPCRASAWQQVLGEITPEQLRAWSQAQERNGLHAQSQPRRNIYWIDSAAPWTQSLGDTDDPVLLVFSAQACSVRCPSIANGVRTVGTVVLQTQCQDDKARNWRAGHIQGQLVVESGLPDLQSGSHIQGQTFTKAAYRLAWPDGMDARRVQRVPGSWREGPQ